MLCVRKYALVCFCKISALIKTCSEDILIQAYREIASYRAVFPSASEVGQLRNYCQHLITRQNKHIDALVLKKNDSDFPYNAWNAHPAFYELPKQFCLESSIALLVKMSFHSILIHIRRGSVNSGIQQRNPFLKLAYLAGKSFFQSQASPPCQHG